MTLLTIISFIIASSCFALPGGVDDLNFLLPESSELFGTDALDYFRSLPEKTYQKVKAYHDAKEAYEKRRNRSFARLASEMRLARSRQIIAGAVAAGATNVILSRLITSPKHHHLLAKIGAIGGAGGGMVLNRVITAMTRSIRKKIKSINQISQLTEGELYTYTNNLQLRMKFERIGIPQPFSNGSRRLHLPKKVISFLRQYRKKEFKTPKEAGTYLKEGLSRFITSYIETLHHIYYILRTSSSFLWMSAGISALDLPKTHRRVVEAEQPPAVSQ